MLLKRTGLSEDEARRLMDIYAEGNVENAAYLYPDMADRAEAKKRAEGDFLSYLRQSFFGKPENVCYIWEADGIWVSALRLSRLSDGCYLEAIETRPDVRGQGFGKKLLLAVLAEADPALPVRDCVARHNTASLALHRACGFQIELEEGIDRITGQTEPRCYGLIWQAPSK